MYRHRELFGFGCLYIDTIPATCLTEVLIVLTKRYKDNRTARYLL